MGNQGVDGPPGPKVEYQEPIFSVILFTSFSITFRRLYLFKVIKQDIMFN